MRHEATTIYCDVGQLRRQAAAWAKRMRRETGITVSKPQSAYVRWLLDQDRKGGK